jgi:hypothetical protein
VKPLRRALRDKRIFLMNDYYASPLWESRLTAIGPNQLPLSDGLTDDLNAWAKAYDESSEREGWPENGWSEEEAAAHDAAGRELWVRVADELPEWEVGYFDNRSKDVIWDVPRRQPS